MLVTAAGTDPETTPLTYEWDLDNDGIFETPGQSATFDASTLDGAGQLHHQGPRDRHRRIDRCCLRHDGSDKRRPHGGHTGHHP